MRVPIVVDAAVRYRRAVGRVLVAALLFGSITSCAATEEPDGATAPTTPATPSLGAPADLPPPPPGGVGFDYQLGGDYPVPEGAGVVVRQWSDGVADPEAYSICYINAFQTEADGDETDSWPAELVLDDVDPEWPGEHPIDISTDRLRTAAAEFVAERVRRCADAGFDGVEWDNLDSYQRYPTAPFGRDDAIAYARLLTEAAHGRGLAAGQKNTPDLLDAARTEIGFDFAIVEQCGEFDECEPYVEVYADRVFDIEYTDDGLDAACAAIGAEATVIRRDLDLLPAGEPGHLYRTC